MSSVILGIFSVVQESYFISKQLEPCGLPAMESAPLMAVDLPVLDWPEAINTGQPKLTLMTAE